MGTITIGAELGRGGEGTVFEVQGRPDRVAKVFHTVPETESRDKLSAMVRAGRSDLTAFCAWPDDILKDERGALRGILMPRVPGGFKPIHLLYSPRSRVDAFPDAGWRFLCHVATNLVRAFGAIHSAGHVVGDVNHANVLVGATGVVRIIDCDSFQVREGNRVFRCRVGVSTHTAPELQGVNLGGIDRTPTHDGFGLAVLVYQLLMMGRHPFAGRHEASGEMTVERAIREHRYVFGRDAPRLRTHPPPLCAPIEIFPRVVRDGFESAFGPNGGRQRPSAKHWLGALDVLTSNLTACAANRAHEYPSEAPSCPWCGLEARAGVVLFQWIRAVTAGNSFDPDLLLKRIQVVLGAPFAVVGDHEKAWNQALYQSRPGPPVLPPMTESARQPSPGLARIEARVRGGRDNARLISWTGAGVLGIGGIAAGLAANASPCLLLPAIPALAWIATLVEGHLVGRHIQPERAVLQEILLAESEAARQLATAQQHWEKPPAILDLERLSARLGRAHSDAEASIGYFKRITAELRERSLREAGQLRDRWRALPGERTARLRAMSEQADRLALSRHLSKFLLENAGLPGIGPSRLHTLRFHGITTAADIDAAALDGIVGIGPTLSSTLLAWRGRVAQGYIRDPRAVAPPMLQAQVDAAIRSEQDAAERALSTLADAARLQYAAINKRATEKLGPLTAEIVAGTELGVQLCAKAIESWSAQLPELLRAQDVALQAVVDAKVARELLARGTGS
ncbi:MAG: hypothetical protein V4850_23075 [Myxococcota bacterium]